MEEKSGSKLSFNRVIIIAGTYLAFAIGAGCASGQEILQYFAVYGVGFVAAITIFLIMGILMDGEFISTGQREQFSTKGGVYRYYAGKYLGTFFDYFTNLFMYMSFVVMCAGAGATLQQGYGLPTWVGVIIMAVASGLTVTLGLNRIADIIGRIGPVMIIIIIAICIINIVNGQNSVVEGANNISTTEGILNAGPNWGVATFNYGGFGILWVVGFLPLYGKTLRSQKEAWVGQTIGVILFTVTVIIVVLSMFANYKLMSGAQIPILSLASQINPTFGVIYTVLILFAIYTSAVPILYSPATRFVDEKTPKGKIVIVLLACLGAFVALLLPYNVLLNYIYTLNGYVGILFLALVVVRVIIRVYRNRKAKAAA